jgi:hypothetical protein
MINEDDLLELARECARRVVENDILAVRQGQSGSLHGIWSLCPEAYAVIEDDADLRDRLLDMIGTELEEVQINYLLRGETAKDGHRRRLSLDRERARLRLIEAESRYANLDAQFRALEDGS